MAIRLPAGLLRVLLRFLVKPFLGPPFPVEFERFWEIILDDSTGLADRCREAGVDVTLQKFDGLWHEFQIHAGMLEAADEAITRISEFLDAHWR